MRSLAPHGLKQLRLPSSELLNNVIIRSIIRGTLIEVSALIFVRFLFIRQEKVSDQM